MSFLASFLAAAVPMTVYLIIIWRLDRNEREPWNKVIKHFIWGAAGAVLIGFIFSYIFNFSAEFVIKNKATAAFIGTVIIAPLVEETVKSIYLLSSYKKDYFDNLTDGLVYGAAIGLGFGMTENLLYFTFYDSSLGEWISVVFIRSLFSAVMHAIATACVGAFLANAKFSKYKKFMIFAGLSIAVIIHFLWNFSLSFDFTFIFGILFMVIIIILFIYVFRYSLDKEINIILAELSDDFERLQICYDDKKRKLFLLNNTKNVFTESDSRIYLHFATKLAFSKLQAKNSTDRQKEYYLAKVNDLEKKLEDILTNKNKRYS